MYLVDIFENDDNLVEILWNDENLVHKNHENLVEILCESSRDLMRIEKKKRNLGDHGTISTRFLPLTQHM